MSANLYELLTRHCRGDSGAPCIITDDRTISYAQLQDAAGRVARYLGNVGLRPGDRIVVQSPKSPEIVEIYLAALQIGAVFVPLNTAYTQSEIDYFIEDSTPALVITNAIDFAAKARHLEPLKEVTDRGSNDAAAILYTSGTTGRSKGAVLSHGNLSSNAAALVNAWQFTERDILLHALPVFHVHGLFVGVHCALLAGASMLWLPRFGAAEVISLLPRATVMMGVPTFYARMLQASALDKKSTAGIRLFICGSAPLQPSALEEFEERTGHRILDRYGMTETLIISTNPIDGPRVPGSVGYPLPGISVRLNEGCVFEVSGPNVLQGYWNRPELVEDVFTSDGYFVTGDVGSIDPDGRMWILGRANDMIISGGFNVYPVEIELVLNMLPAVTDSAVIGVPHPDLGEAVVAVVVGAGPEEELISATRNSLAPYKCPKRVFFVEDLPRTALGKVQKGVLRAQFADTFSGEVSC